jgi:hypothetical protein
MIDQVVRWLRDITTLALVLVALGVVLQILFPGALVFINANVAGNLINLINQFSGAGLVGLIAAVIILYLLRGR